MAYVNRNKNIETQDHLLKGLDRAVDNHSNQKVYGHKKFEDGITAANYYTPDGEEVTVPPIKTIASDGENRVLVSKGNSVATTDPNLLLIDGKLGGESIIFSGSAEMLHSLPAMSITGRVHPNNIEYGNGLLGKDDKLTIHTGVGIRVNSDGLSVKIKNNAGLGIMTDPIDSGKLFVDPSSPIDISNRGQTLADDDTLIVYDHSEQQVRKTTLRNLYHSYIGMNMPQADGSPNEVQYCGRNGFRASSTFSFNPINNTLQVEGTTNSRNIICDNLNHGAVYASCKTVAEDYTILSTDYTIFVDCSAGDVKVVLPNVSENTGRIVVIKKISELNSVSISCSGGKIESLSTYLLGNHGEVCRVQSNGINWWII
tara:strand:+ start:70 stop:1179 length:1110 start_codon:yes stop_codon:yes gene_type:complete